MLIVNQRQIYYSEIRKKNLELMELENAIVCRYLYSSFFM